MGHVNNAVYSTYLEEARIGVLGDLIDFILARVEIDFRSELRSRRGGRGADALLAGRDEELRPRARDRRPTGVSSPRRRASSSPYDYERGESRAGADELRAHLTSP
jgi:hypothetical protein